MNYCYGFHKKVTASCYPFSFLWLFWSITPLCLNSDSGWSILEPNHTFSPIQGWISAATPNFSLTYGSFTAFSAMWNSSWQRELDKRKQKTEQLYIRSDLSVTFLVPFSWDVSCFLQHPVLHWTTSQGKLFSLLSLTISSTKHKQSNVRQIWIHPLPSKV